MDCQGTSCIPLSQSELIPAPAPVSWPAQRLLPQQRQELAIRALAGAETISELARQHEVSRKFVYQQVAAAEVALDRAFAPPPESEVAMADVDEASAHNAYRRASNDAAERR